MAFVPVKAAFFFSGGVARPIHYLSTTTHLHTPMQYIQIEFKFQGEDFSEQAEILTAYLSDYPFESFEDTPTGMRGYIPKNQYDKNEIAAALNGFSKHINFHYDVSEIAEQNWNQLWESNYEPVMIDGQCFIRAPFHQPDPAARYNILIEPKMSFGTAHHETTSMMISFVMETHMDGKLVLDMGCGTGVLAILASMRGASGGEAIDNDTWAYENTIENLQRNNIENIRAHCGGKELLGATTFDIVLANINRNILLDQIADYAKITSPKGLLFMSGFYQEDVETIIEAASREGFQLVEKKSKNNWVALKMEMASG
jgi:ribosomal protein L11 methyltransferase